jgi:3-hydroxyacyl-[acyl-carrier-protein] dehydratase
MEKINDTKVKLDKKDIYKYLKNRPPFLLIDEAIVEPGKSSVTEKYLTEEEWYFPCHFPGNPMMPGVLQLETMFQTAAMAIKILEGYEEKTTNIVQVASVKYKGHIRPNNLIKVYTEVDRFKRGMANIHGKIYVEDKVCCEAEFELVVLGDIPVIGEINEFNE